MLENGFTLIEIIIVVAIIGIVLSFGITIDLNKLKGDTFQFEVATIVSILERARSQAMSNLGDSNHGFCYMEPNYILFTGNTCTVTNSEIIQANTDIASSALTTFPTEIIFERLSGRTNNTEILVSHGLQETNIKINNEGAIDW